MNKKTRPCAASWSYLVLCFVPLSLWPGIALAASAPGEELPAASPSSEPPTSASSARGDETTEASPTYQRTGVQTLIALGTSSCFQTFCRPDGLFDRADLLPGPLLGVELGYRPIPYLDILGGLTLSYQPVNGVGKHTYTAGWWAFNVGVDAFPLKSSRLDPYAGLALTYYQAWFADGGDIDHTVMLSRGSARFGIGVDVFVTRRFSIGPRFAQHVAFRGRTCHWVDVPGASVDKTCHHFQNVPREIERGTAQPWELALVLKWHKRPRG